MYEEKAPSPLPAVLPTGTLVRPFGDSRTDETTEPARLHSSLSGGGRYAGANDYTIRCKGGNWGVSVSANDTSMIDWSSVAALRASQPSDEREEPKVGETWLAAVWTDGVMTKERPVTITRLGETCADIEGGENYSARLPGHYLNYNWCLVRRLSAPSADKLEPALGQEVEGVAFVEGRGTVRGEVTRLASKYYGHSLSDEPRIGPMVRDDDGNEWTLDPKTVRPATPSPKAEEATLPPCQHRNVNLYTMRCDDCGMTAAQVRAKAEKVAERVDPPAAKLDPYAAHRRDLVLRSVEHYSGPESMLDKRIAAAKAQHLADLDRKLPARGKWDWDVDDSDELRVT